MSYYVISIGGSGAKCVEAILHMSAAGLMPEGELNIIFIDPDVTNGNLQRVQNTFQLYRDCKKIKLGNINLLKNNITAPRPNVWSPLSEVPPTLEKLFRYAAIKSRNEVAAHMFDVLYSPAEKEVLFDEGFLGHPSIGAAVMAKTVKMGETEPWKTLRDKIRIDAGTGSDSKVILVGSIFGGTGGSGIPIISKLIQKEFKDISTLKIGGIFILPYFSFLPAEKELREGRVFKLNPENLILNTQATLRYYYNHDILNCFNYVYLLGEQAMAPIRNTSPGGKSQANAPHFLELYASLAAIDFFSDKNAEYGDPVAQNFKYKMISRNSYGKLEWTDLPDNHGSNAIKKGLGNLTRFAFAFLNVYYPKLKHIKESGKAKKAPWFNIFFKQNNLSLNDMKVQDDLYNIKNYCENFLEWFANIHRCSDEIKVEFVNIDSFSEIHNGITRLLEADKFRSSDFANIVLPFFEEKSNTLNELWKRMCHAKVQDTYADGVGRFIHALFRESRLGDIK